jgi:hypothetical protein
MRLEAGRLICLVLFSFLEISVCVDLWWPRAMVWLVVNQNGITKMEKCTQGLNSRSFS